MSKLRKAIKMIDSHMEKMAKMITQKAEYKGVLKCMMVLAVLAILVKALCRSRVGKLPVVRSVCGAGDKTVVYVRRVGDSAADVLAHPLASAERVARHPVDSARDVARRLNPFA
jgi:hypothetical protein